MFTRIRPRSSPNSAVTTRVQKYLYSGSQIRPCPDINLLRTHLKKNDLRSLTACFCGGFSDGPCRPVFAEWRKTCCRVDINMVAQCAIEESSPSLRMLIVHNASVLNFPLLLKKAVDSNNKTAFQLIYKLAPEKESDPYQEIWYNLGKTGNMSILKKISYQEKALHGLLEEGHWEEAKAYAGYNSVTKSGLAFKIWTRDSAGQGIELMDALEIIMLTPKERNRLLYCTLNTIHLDAVKYLLRNNPEVDIINLFARCEFQESVDAVRNCLPKECCNEHSS